jgi:hypothetical protein
MMESQYNKLNRKLIIHKWFDYTFKINRCIHSK